MSSVALVTGASRGIGRATALLFAQEGYSVAINYLKARDKAEDLVRELTALGHNAIAFHADVRENDQVKQMVKEVRSALGPIDVLVNNAGTAQQKLFTDITECEWDDIFATHVKGTFFCSQQVLPDMIRRKQGAIVNVSSIWGLMGASCEVHYSAAKAAVIGMTRALAREVGPSGIRVNCVAPGVVATEMNSDLDELTVCSLKEQTALGQLGTVDDIARVIYFLASENAHFITGQIISPNGGLLI